MPAMAADTTDLSYWLNWRFFVSAIFVFSTIGFALLLIWKYEGGKKLDNQRRERQQVPAGVLFKDEFWKSCLKGIHPAWLLGFRIFAFCVLLALIIANTIHDGSRIYFFYTQWTFTLTTLYFAIASAFSLYGCWRDCNGPCHFKIASPNIDAEQGVVPEFGGSPNTPFLKHSTDRGELHFRQISGFMGYLFQVMFQVAAGAVLLTDVVFWFIIYPFMTATNTKLAFFDVSMHSVNILILGDAILNGMRFPMFRIAYFILYTAAFVICQWIIHACVNLDWPYPFMDLSPPIAPVWYAAVGFLHLPCYGCFSLIVKLKHVWLSRSFPDSFQVLR